MVLEPLQEREESVLSLVIRRYVDTAKPVGSQTLADELGFSSATIRNVLMDLEQKGYLTHPHTSAGRVPLDQGYRFYVDRLMKARALNLRERQQVEQEYQDAKTETETLLRHTAHILSVMTRLAGVSALHAPEEIALDHFKLVPIDARRVIVVLVLSQGLVREELVRLDGTVHLKEVSQIAQFLNSRFKGVSLSSIREALLKEAERVKKTRLGILESALKLIDNALGLGAGNVTLEGASQLVEQPEFQDPTRMEQVLRLVEERQPLVNALGRQWDRPGLSVEIGRESSQQSLRAFSFVHVPCYHQGQVVGALGVLGPTRMAYDRVTGLVQDLARYLEETLNHYGENYGG